MESEHGPQQSGLKMVMSSRSSTLELKLTILLLQQAQELESLVCKTSKSAASKCQHHSSSSDILHDRAFRMKKEKMGQTLDQVDSTSAILLKPCGEGSRSTPVQSTKGPRQPQTSSL